MGNNLCATWQRGYKAESRWPVKDPHLIRLWAEIFKVKEENNQWSRISEDVVPINVFCIQNSPETVLQVIAYNRLVEKIFDVFITQPGTEFSQSSECFVHWRDEKSGHEWGLNFTNSCDARAFRSCCTVPIPPISGLGTSSIPDSSQFHKRPLAEKLTSFPDYSLPPNLLLPPKNANISESSKDRRTNLVTSDTNSHYSSPTHRHSLAEHQNSNCRPRVAQPYQVRQIMSVYLDSRCRCSAGRVSAEHRGNPTGSYSLPSNIPVTNQERLRRLERLHGDGNMNMALFKQQTTVCSKHCCPVGRVPMEAVDYDNSVNQKICQYMAARILEKPPLALEWKAGARCDRGDEVGGRNHRCCYSSVGRELPRRLNGPEATGSNNCVSKNHAEGNANRKRWSAEDKIREYDCKEMEREDRSFVSTVQLGPSQEADSAASDLSAADVIRSDSIAAALQRERIDSRETRKEELIVADGQNLMLNNREEIEKTVSTSIKPSSSPGDAEKNFVSHSAINVTYDHPRVPQTASVMTTEGSAVRHSDQRGIPQNAEMPVDIHKTDAVKSDLPTNRWSPEVAAVVPDADPKIPLVSEENDDFERPQNNLCNVNANRSSFSFPESNEVRRMIASDVSGSEGGSDVDEGWDCGSLHTMPSQASFASKSTVVRRVGWLSVKNWLVHRKCKIELAPKRTWKKYWVCLKGNILHFFTTDESANLSDDVTPRHKLVIEGALVQPTPEHPKKENAFSLSTAFGDAYLFQASNLTDLDNWIRAVHSACAASLARQHGKMNTLRLLSNEVHRLDTSIDMDIKMRKMALMHLTNVTDSRSRQAIEKQVNQWEKNLEKLYIDHYRLKCYIASLQGTELPNPKSLLGSVSKNTKVFLSRIGVFTVSAFHAFVCARTFSTSSRAGFVTSTDTCQQKLGTLNPTVGPRTQSFRMFSLPPNQTNRQLSDMKNANDDLLLPLKQTSKSLLRIKLPNSQTETSIQVTPDATVQDVVEAACNKNRLNTRDYFLQLNMPSKSSIKVPERNTRLLSEEYENIELCPKLMRQVELVRTAKDFGFQVEAELAEDAEQEDELCLFISDVTAGGIAAGKGLAIGDEILVINGRIVAELDMVFIENVLQETKAVSLTLRSCQSDALVTFSDCTVFHSCGIENLMCPPPPTQMPITDENIGNLIVPAPNLGNCKEIPDLLRMRIRNTESGMASEQIDHLLKGVNQVMHLCHRQYSLRSSNLPDNGNSEPAMSLPPMSSAQHICKVVLELVDTERSYVRDLTCLIERYLEPLKDETYISSDDVEQLFGNIQEIVQFQRLFLHCLEDAICSDPNFNNYNDNRLNDEGLARVLLQIGNSFLHYAHHFKLYSSFCASHSKAQKMILSDDNVELREFLLARNPKQQHSSALESYLIKPIQRILKYPLLLKQLCELTDPHSDERCLLRDALGAMESVAEHINEMQKIYEEYGSEFEQLMKIEKQERHLYKYINLGVGELQMYGTVNWVNFADEIGKSRKGYDLQTFIFIFKSAVVILTQERLKARKRSKTAGLPITPIRYKTAIPVGELQVRSVIGDPSDCRGLWEIIHLRSEKEGRPKKTFQFLSSLKARNDFIRTIHRAVHEKCEGARHASAGNRSSHPVQGTPYHQPKYSLHSETDPERRDNTTTKDQVTSKDNCQNSCPMRTSSAGLYGAAAQPVCLSNERRISGNSMEINQRSRRSRSNTTSPLCYYDNVSSFSSINRNRTNSYSCSYEHDSRTSNHVRKENVNHRFTE